MWNSLMKNWIQKQLAGDNMNVGLQALRNLILANTGLISAMLVILGLIIGFSSNLSNTLIFSSINPNLQIGALQIIIIGIWDFTAVFSLILSSRASTSLSFLISSDFEEKDGLEGKGELKEKTKLERKIKLNKNQEQQMSPHKLIENLFLSMQKFWLIGIRSLFFLITAMTWIIDPIFFLISTLLMFFYLTFIQDLAVFQRKT